MLVTIAYFVAAINGFFSTADSHKRGLIYDKNNSMRNCLLGFML